jgi:hypothetical protein
MISTIAQTRAPSAETSLKSRVLIALMFSTIFVAGSFIWQGRDGFNMGDEGFLWYGVQRVLAGEVPLLDFMSYDPGRYYWSAAVMRLMHDNGIMAMRGAAAVFQLLGVFVGLLLLVRPKSRLDVPLLTLAAITLTVWMYNWFKVYDSALCLILIGILTFLVEQPSNRRFFLAGLTVGLVAVFGRNHGIYGVAGVLGVVIYFACRHRSLEGLISGLFCFGCGVFIGYLPILIMIVAVPGFAAAFWESIRFITERGATNLTLPVPWPWLVLVGRVRPSEILIGLLFVAILAFGVLSLLWVIRQAMLRKPVPPQFVAASMLALPYAHYAFSRAELFHLALAIFPMLIGIFILIEDLPQRRRWAAAVMGVSLIVALPNNTGWNCLVLERCVTMQVGGNTLRVQPLIAGFVTMLTSVTERYAPDGRNYLVTPLWPAAYTLFNRKSPMWDSHALFPRDKQNELKEIERIKAADPGFVMILDQAVDGRDDLRFRNTHPLIEQYVRDNFDPITVEKFPPPTFQFYKSR